MNLAKLGRGKKKGPVKIQKLFAKLNPCEKLIRNLIHQIFQYFIKL